MIETPEKIHHNIEDKLSRGISYIDALVEYAKERNVEIETIAEIVKKSDVIREKIRQEASVLKLIKRDEDANQLCD